MREIAVLLILSLSLRYLPLRDDILWRRESVIFKRYLPLRYLPLRYLTEEESYWGKRLPSVCSGLIFCFKASRRKKIWLSLESISQEGSHLSHSPTDSGG